MTNQVQKKQPKKWQTFCAFCKIGSYCMLQHLAQFIFCRPRSWNLTDYPIQSSRIVVANQLNNDFPDNYVSNTKYTLFTFVPHTLYEQFFRSHLNRYFLLIACLQLWKEVAPVSPLTIWAPLLIAISITGRTHRWCE